MPLKRDRHQASASYISSKRARASSWHRASYCQSPSRCGAHGGFKIISCEISASCPLLTQVNIKCYVALDSVWGSVADNKCESKCAERRRHLNPAALWRGGEANMRCADSARPSWPPEACPPPSTMFCCNRLTGPRHVSAPQNRETAVFKM